MTHTFNDDGFCTHCGLPRGTAEDHDCVRELTTLGDALLLQDTLDNDILDNLWEP